MIASIPVRRQFIRFEKGVSGQHAREASGLEASGFPSHLQRAEHARLLEPLPRLVERHHVPCTTVHITTSVGANDRGNRRASRIYEHTETRASGSGHI